MGKWEIVGRRDGETELLDETDDEVDAQFLQKEYEMAFGPEWFIYRRRVA